MRTESCSIPSFNPATGRISTKSLSRSKRSNSFAALRRVKSVKTVTSLKRNGVLNSLLGVFAERLNFNAERRTSNAERRISCLRVRRSVFGVLCQSGSDRSAFSSAFGRVKGAWWPPRSSKPPSVGNGRDRFDSYPLRQLIFDLRSAIFEREPFVPKSQFEIPKSRIRKGGDCDATRANP